jgi:hypothetical protein
MAVPANSIKVSIVRSLDVLKIASVDDGRLPGEAVAASP